MTPLAILPNPNPLDQIQIATPCDARWDDMLGDNRVRFCGACTKHVYNLSEMQQEEALALIQEMNGNLCVRLYRRPDGTVLTEDCPVGLLAKARQKARQFYAGAFAMGLSLMAGITGAFDKKECATPSETPMPTQVEAGHVQPKEPVRVLPREEVIMGELKMPEMGEVAPRSPTK